MPLMHHGLNQRLTSLNEKCKLDLISMADYGNIENFSLRDYIKIELLFKLFFFFILFGIHMKGYNIPVFITLLMIYYWYYLYMDINAFYDKKIAEIKLTKEEIREVKNDFRGDEDKENNLVRENYKDDSKDNLKDLDNKLIDGKEKEENKLTNENDISYDINYVKDNDIIVEDEDIKTNRVRNIKNSINENVATDHLNTTTINNSPKKEEKILPEIEGISNLMKKYDKKEKRKISRDENEEGVIQYYASFIFEILFTLVMSLFPFWYDEFEAHNPVITQNNIQINNINTQPPTQSQNISDEDVALPDGDHMKVVENEINKSNKIYSNEVTPTREEQDSLRPEIEMVSNKDKLPDDPKSHNSEKILIKSSNDTRLVNHSEDHNMNNNNVVTKYILVDENENKTENEFVFSENVNIDTLSYNEPLLESMKKKNEKEQEENHINLKKLD